jgi:hypothetical protein
MHYKWNDNEDNADDYNKSSYEHGSLGEVEAQHIKVLSDALKNFDDMEYDIEPAKGIMFEYLKNNKILKDNSDIKNYGIMCYNESCYNETLYFIVRDKKLRDKTYLFNTETGEVYFINETLMKHIDFEKYYDYNKVITGGIESALEVISDIQLFLSFRGM